MIPAATSTSRSHNTAGLYDDIDMCVTVTTVTGVEPENAKAWRHVLVRRRNNFYVFEIAPNGKALGLAAAARQVAGAGATGRTPIAPTRATAPSTSSASRPLGSEATFYVNGTEFKKITGSPPDNGQQIGAVRRLAGGRRGQFAFDDLKVTHAQAAGTSDDSPN